MKFSGIILFTKLAKAKNNTNYAQLSVHNGTDKITINVWAVGATNPYKLGGRFSCDSVKEDNGFYSCTSKDVVFYEPMKNDPLSYLLPKVVSYDDWELLRNECLSFIVVGESQEFWEKKRNFLIKMFDKLYKPFSEYPAATTHHHAYPGGLLQHTYEVVKVFATLYSGCALPCKVDPFITTVGCLCHDLGKIRDYKKDGSVTSHISLIEHPSGSALLLAPMLADYGFSQDIIDRCVHCVLAHHLFKEWGSPVTPANPEAFIVAMCDMISGKGTMFETANDGDRLDGNSISKYKPND